MMSLSDLDKEKKTKLSDERSQIFIRIIYDQNSPEPSETESR